jgi:hypothetical protein
MFRRATALLRLSGFSPANSGHSVSSSTTCASWADSAMVVA